MKKSLVVCSVVLTLILFAVPVFAAQNEEIRVEYDGLGRVEVDFRRDVRYSEPQVSVQDSTGAALPAVILDLDDDDLDFVVENLVPGETYSFTITGVRYSGEADAVPFTGGFRVPGEGELVIKKLDYDREDRELEIDFNARVEYEQLSVTIQDASGKSYEASIREKDRDGVELRVNGLERGVEYSVTVSGIRLADSANTFSLTGSFKG